MHSLARLLLRLTAWYVGVFLSILALLGGGLFLAIRHRMSQQLDASLRAAASALMQAARIREAELAGAKGVVADAVDELHIPDRALYLFGAGATPIKPAEAPDWIREAAREAERAGAAHRDLEREDHIVRLYAERFSGANGRVYVATAVADRLELEHEYASLIRAFAAAALAALLLAAGGGYMLTRQSTAPIERSMEQMRRFMADAAHELRTPITVLRTRAEVAASQDREPTRDAATLQAIEREATGRAVVVRAPGMGAPPERRPPVSGGFYRGARARRGAAGAGLGLAIARWIADVHGARIDVGSEPAVGTRVTLSFPLAL